MDKKVTIRKRSSSKTTQKEKAHLDITEKTNWVRIIFDFAVNTSLILGIIYLASITPTINNWFVYAKGIMAAFVITYLGSNFFISKARVGLFTTAEMSLFVTLWIRFIHIT